MNEKNNLQMNISAFLTAELQHYTLKRTSALLETKINRLGWSKRVHEPHFHRKHFSSYRLPLTVSTIAGLLVVPPVAGVILGKTGSGIGFYLVGCLVGALLGFLLCTAVVLVLMWKSNKKRMADYEARYAAYEQALEEDTKRVEKETACKPFLLAELEKLNAVCNEKEAKLASAYEKENLPGGVSGLLALGYLDEFLKAGDAPEDALAKLPEDLPRDFDALADRNHPGIDPDRTVIALLDKADEAAAALVENELLYGFSDPNANPNVDPTVDPNTDRRPRPGASPLDDYLASLRFTL